jgi:hypothetical protein
MSTRDGMQMVQDQGAHVIGSYLKVRLGLTAAVAAALSSALFAQPTPVPSGAAPAAAHGQLNGTAARHQLTEVPLHATKSLASPVPTVAFAPDTAGVPVPPIL